MKHLTSRTLDRIKTSRSRRRRKKDQYEQKREIGRRMSNEMRQMKLSGGDTWYLDVTRERADFKKRRKKKTRKRTFLYILFREVFVENDHHHLPNKDHWHEDCW